MPKPDPTDRRTRIQKPLETPAGGPALTVVGAPPARVFREVLPEWRSGRGVWWRTKGQGYTDKLENAGLYNPDTEPEWEDYRKYIEFPAIEAIEQAIQETVDRLNKLGELMAAVRQP